MQSLKFYAIWISSLVLLTNCATMFNSGSQSIMVRGSGGEEDVKVEITTPNGSYNSKLPTTISADSSNSDVKIEVTDKCYDNTSVQVDKSVTPSFWVNIIIWPGLIVDAVTGKMWKYDNNVNVPLRKKKGCKDVAGMEPLSLEKTKKYIARNIHWKIESDPQGAVINYRINSSTQEVSSTPNTYLERTPYEGVKRLEVKGVTHENMKHIVISIEVSRAGYYSQKKEIAFTAIIQSNEISLHFALAKKE